MQNVRYIIKNIDENTFSSSFVLIDEVMGSAVIKKTDEKTFEVSNIFIKEEYRRFKHGSKILSAAFSEVKKLGGETLFAEAPAELLPFFEKNGFEKCGVTYKKDGARYIKVEKSFVFDGCMWLSFNKELEAAIVKKSFNYTHTHDKNRVYLTVSALGFSEIFVNGKSVSDRLFAPAWSNYNARDLSVLCYPIFDTLTYRVYYERFDITDLLVDGKNTVVFHIGGGWYCQHESRNEGINKYGFLKLCFKITQDGEIIAKSDGDTLFTKSFITRANIYFGETQDLRRGNYDFSTEPTFGEWKKCDEDAAPLSLFRLSNYPEDRVVRRLYPKCIFRRGDYAIYDIGENVAGFPVIRFKDGAALDERCLLRFAEELKSDGSLDFHYSGGRGRMQCEEYIYDGSCKAALHQHFTWHGARYFEVLGEAEVLEYCVAHTDIKKIISFKSSEPVLQWIFDAFIRTQLDNIHCSVPSDCPHRERLGYTGDGQLASRAVMTCFDAEALYRKWLDDIADSQDIFSGHVEHTAPFYGGGGGPGGWGGAMVFVPYNFYEFYGDKTVLEKYYPNMLLYLDYMESHSENSLVVRGEKGGWCLGDWCAPHNKNCLPEPFVNTYFYIRALMCVIEISKILKKDSSVLQERAERIKKAFLEKYFDEKSGTFFGSVEAADAFGFDLGLGNEKTLENIVEKYEKLGEFDTGIFGTYVLIKTLCENGEKKLAKKLLTSNGENSFYNMMKHGATTLWENWDGCDSRNHPMFGAVTEFIVKYFNEVTNY